MYQISFEISMYDRENEWKLNPEGRNDGSKERDSIIYLGLFLAEA